LDQKLMYSAYRSVMGASKEIMTSPFHN